MSAKGHKRTARSRDSLKSATRTGFSVLTGPGSMSLKSQRRQPGRPAPPPFTKRLLTLAGGRGALLLSALRRRRALHVLLGHHDAVVGSGGVLRPARGIGAGREADRRNCDDRVNQMFHLFLPDCRNPGAGKLGRNGRPNQDGARKNGAAIEANRRSGRARRLPPLKSLSNFSGSRSNLRLSPRRLLAINARQTQRGPESSSGPTQVVPLRDDLFTRLRH
jgi:hypothetical protein